MHKGVILLVKAKNRGDAEMSVNSFMDMYGNGNVWDWFVIGGRWTGTLSGYDPRKDPRNYETCWLCNGTGLRDDRLGEEERQRDPNYLCNGCASYDPETKKWMHNPMGRGLHLKHSFEKHDGDIMRLKDCLDVVKKWRQDPDETYEKEMEDAERKWGKSSPKYDRAMMGYCMKTAAMHLKEEFNFDTNVYNVEDFSYSIPEDVDGWFAVMVDMHN